MLRVDPSERPLASDVVAAIEALVKGAERISTSTTIDRGSKRARLTSKLATIASG